jgi:hypothetical protein
MPRGGSQFPYLRFCRILIKMADVFFSSSWRILEPYGRSVQRLAQMGQGSKCSGPEPSLRVEEAQLESVRDLGDRGLSAHAVAGLVQRR